jgi:hypothetical protein
MNGAISADLAVNAPLRQPGQQLAWYVISLDLGAIRCAATLTALINQHG